MKSVGFKEWAVVCEALGRGRQSIIVRKGGIAEGRDGFSFKHKAFYLFPTWFHEQPEKVRSEPDWRLIGIPPMKQAAESASLEIRYAAQVDICRTITSLETAEALAPLHILQPDVVRERFQYDKAAGLHVALVRVFRIEPSWSFPNEPKYGGCRSWVKLPEAPKDLRFEPVISDAEHARRRAAFAAITSVEAVPSG
jgi:hypothetical protein